MLNKKKIAIAAATGIVIMVCGVLVYMNFIKEPAYDYTSVPETTITEQQEVDIYKEIMSNIEVDEESSIIVNPTIDEDTGSMSGENSKGEFIQTPPIEIPESEEDILRELLENAGVSEEVTEQTVKEKYPTEPAKPVESKPQTPSEPTKPVENKPADPPVSGGNTWQGKDPFADQYQDSEGSVNIKPGEGSGDTTDTTKFN